MKQDGAFVCQNCGMKYSVEEAKKMMIEGTVDVQGTVKVDNSASVERQVQMMQWLEGKDGNKTLLTYSIGNFLSTMYNDYFMVGGMLSFDIVKNASGTRIEAAQLVPTVTYYDVNRANLSIYFLDEFTPELASSHGTNAHGTTSIEKLRGYVTNAIPAEFLPESYQK